MQEIYDFDDSSMLSARNSIAEKEFKDVKEVIEVKKFKKSKKSKKIPKDG